MSAMMMKEVQSNSLTTLTILPPKKVLHYSPFLLLVLSFYAIFKKK